MTHWLTQHTCTSRARLQSGGARAARPHMSSGIGATRAKADLQELQNELPTPFQTAPFENGVRGVAVTHWLTQHTCTSRARLQSRGARAARPHMSSGSGVTRAKAALQDLQHEFLTLVQAAARRPQHAKADALHALAEDIAASSRMFRGKGRHARRSAHRAPPVDHQAEAVSPNTSSAPQDLFPATMPPHPPLRTSHSLPHTPPPHNVTHIPPNHTDNMSSFSTSPNSYYSQYQEAPATPAAPVCTSADAPPVLPTAVPTAGRRTFVHARAVTPTATTAVETLTHTRIGSTTTAPRNARKTLTTDSDTNYYGRFSLPACLHTIATSSLPKYTPLTHTPPPHNLTHIPPKHTVSLIPTSPNRFYSQYQEAPATPAAPVCASTDAPPVKPTAGREVFVHARAVTPTALSAVEPLTPTRIGSTTKAPRNARKTLTTDSITTYNGGFSFPVCFHTIFTYSSSYTRPEDAPTRHLHKWLFRLLTSHNVVTADSTSVVDRYQ